MITLYLREAAGDLWTQITFSGPDEEVHYNTFLSSIDLEDFEESLVSFDSCSFEEL